ncbi:uncharacterized protein LOC142931513 isoform X2 [Anarhichas minor]|uniref:uncharacterized protein LOC142931513 isoform X2 n=1 Tax=Anarhichas minor TaxID=65739 RepID=UPI003F73211B
MYSYHDITIGDCARCVAIYTGYIYSGPDSSNQSSPSSSDRDGGPSDPTWQKSSPEKASQRDQTSPPQDVRSSAKQFSDFLASFPVTTDGKPPTKKQRIDAGFPEDPVFYAKWRANQYRGHYLLYFTHRKPSAGMVSRLMEKEGWKVNHTTVEEILQMWVPASIDTIEGNEQVLRNVATQRWKGLTIKHFGGEKGLGVVATRPFSKGDIVCDYHGKVITADEGKKKMEALKNQPGYMFFFKSGDRALCIDAHTHPCKCHANVETVGRRINHSCKKPNLKPVQCVLKVDGEDTHVILFKTLKDIKVDEELRFD